MIPTLETERMWARPVRLEDAQQVAGDLPAVGDREAPRRGGAVAMYDTVVDVAGRLQFFGRELVP